MKTNWLITTALSLALIASQAHAEPDVAARLAALEKEIALLKRQLEVKEEKEKATNEKAASVEFGKKGLLVQSPDKKYQLSLKGFFQIDSHNFLDDKNNTGRNEFIARRLRPILEAKAGNASFRLMPDFAGSTPRIVDAHADYKLFDALNVRAGKFKSPLGLEHLQSDSDGFFIERGHPSSFSPSRDIGVMLYGDLIPQQLEYQIGVFNGSPDFTNLDNDQDDKKDVIARLFAQPFRNSETVALQGFGLGIAGSYGDRDGTTTTPILPDYRSPGQQTFFRYRTGAAADTTFADGVQWRVLPQAYWFYDRFGLIGEYGVSSQEVTRAASHDTLQHQAWQVAGSVVLTGENAVFKNGVKPANDFNIDGSGWGAFELVARTGAMNIDDDAFPVFASLTQSADSAHSYGVGVNWYLSENLKWAVDYDFTQFDNGATAGDRADEHALFSRVQFRL